MTAETLTTTTSLGSCPVSGSHDYPCHFCGAPMQRSGSCMVCAACGETSGCS